MTVAAAIEIRAGATPTPSLGKTLGAGHGTERADAASYELLSSTVTAATSFRANWQSLLASLGTNLDDFSEANEDQGTASAVLATGQASNKTFVSTLNAGIGLRLAQGNKKGSVETGAVAKMPIAGGQTGVLAAEPTSVAANPASTRSEEKKTAAEPETESVHGSRPARSINATRTDAVTAEPLQTLLAAAIASFSQIAPATSIVNTVARSTNETAQLAQTTISADLSTNQPAAFASAAYGSQPQQSKAPGENAAAINAGVAQTAEGSEMSANPGIASPVPSASGSTGLTLDETVAYKDAPLSDAMLTESVNSPETPASARSLTPSAPTEAQNANPAEILSTSQAPPLTFAPEQSTTLPTAQDQSPIQVATPSQSIAEAIAPSQSTHPSFDASQSRTQMLESSQNTSQATDSNQSPAETQVTSQAPSLTFAPEQSRALPTAQTQNPIQVEALSQSPAAATAPSQSTPSSFIPSQSRAQRFEPSQNTGQATESNQSPEETPATSQATSIKFVPSQSQTQAYVPSKPPIPAQVADLNLTQIATPHTYIAETEATNQGASPTPAPIPHPIPAQVASQSLTQTPSTSPTETQALSHNPSPAFIPYQNQTPTFVKSQEQSPTQPKNQIMNVVAAAMPGDGLNSLPVAAAAFSQASQLVTQSTVLGKPVSASGGKASTSESLRSTRGAGNFDSVQQVSHQIAGQSSSPVVDASTMARSLTGAGGTVSTAGAPMGASSVAASQQDSREAFATLDAAGTPGAPTWIHAGAQRAEVGYQDPALGWVGVRADLSGSGIHAQLVPGSADAAQALGSHLAGLNSYLDEHHTPVETLTLTSPEGGWSGSGSGQGAGEGMQQGAGQQTGQNADASAPSDPYPESVTRSPAASAELPAFYGDINGSTQTASTGSFHISVMA